MNSPKVTIQIITWNSLRYISGCLNSIFQQTYRDFQILVIDSGSQDGTLEFLRNNYPDVAVFQNHKNLGFAKSNNQGFKLLNSPFVLLCNADIILESDWLEKAMNIADSPKYSDYGSFGGKLLKMKLKDNDINEIDKLNLIDSCGLKILPQRLIVEIGAGEDGSLYNNVCDVFGHSAALVLYRKEALINSAIKIDGSEELEFFDEDFFSYKEDVDLAWRMQLFGWKSIYDPSLVAYHARSTSGSEKTSLKDSIKNKKCQSPLAKFYSYRNHFLLLLKNEYKANIRKDFWKIFWFELKKFIFYLLFDIKNIKALFEAMSLRQKMKKKSDFIQANDKSDSQMIYKWIQ